MRSILRNSKYFICLLATTFIVTLVTAQPIPGNKVVVLSSALPTGASTEATLSALNTKVTAVNTGAVVISSALPAGNNNIGDIDVASLPALPAGNNNIGDVDIASSVLPTGAATEATLSTLNGKVTTVNTGAVTISTSLPAGTNAIGKLSANSGVDIGDVDVASLPALPAGTNNIGDVDVASIAAGNNNIGDVDVASLPALPAGTNAIGKLAANSGVDIGDVTLSPSTTGGLTTFHLVSAGSTNATNVKASAGQLYGYFIYNSNAAARKVAFHNTAGTPTAGASIYFTVMIPGGSAANVFTDTGVAFSTGIAITTVTGIPDNDSAAVAANDLIIDLWYN